ncbi:outer membrane protein [Bartonella sp. B23]
MNTKRLIAISISILVTVFPIQASASSAYPVRTAARGAYPVQASISDVYPVRAATNDVYPVRTSANSVYPAPNLDYSKIVVAQPFSWTGIYLGGQIGNFSSTSALNYPKDTISGQWVWIDTDLSPKLLGYRAGLYGGSNIDIGSDFILGFDTDVIFSGKKDTKIGNEKKIRNADELGFINTIFQQANISITKPDSPDEKILNIGHSIVSSVTLKEKWSGAMRIRLGFTSDYVMPYISGGLAYAQMQYIASLLAKSPEDSLVLTSGNVFDKTKIMVGYTFGCGIDFAMIKNIILRAEYRYSDFGKRIFEKDKLEIDHKTNDFRIGFAYKF